MKKMQLDVAMASAFFKDNELVERPINLRR
jgi:hypothetical protein